MANIYGVNTKEVNAVLCVAFLKHWFKTSLLTFNALFIAYSTLSYLRRRVRCRSISDIPYLHLYSVLTKEVPL